MTISDLLDKFYGGNRAALARAAGVTKQAVYQWSAGEELKPEYVIPVCRDLGWRVTPHELAPSIYPNKTDGLPGVAA